jgi:hypothetical protein
MEQMMADDHLEQRAFADAIVDRAAQQFRELLKRLVGEVDQLPPFPGSMFSFGIEVPPPAGSPLGCVIVGEDGELSELQLGLDDAAVESGGDAVAARIEHLEPLDLTSANYIAHAYQAVGAVITYLDTGELPAGAAG